jgi:tripartite-type tricarboxylate transporter receptor subunit TctC
MAKAKPGKMNYSSAGLGSAGYLTGELLKQVAGVDIVHVPYKGAAPVVTDLMGGQVQMAILGIPAVLTAIKAGKIRALVVTSEKRIAAMPELPTSVESGFPTLLTDYWYGLIAAAAIPDAIQTRLRAAAVTTLQSPSVQEQFARVSAVAFPSSAEEFRSYMLAEQAKWGAIIKAIGFKED